MRSIGKVKIKKLYKMVDDYVSSAKYIGNWELSARVIESKVPASWFDIWESAHHEIPRLISDRISAHVIARRDNTALPI